MSAPFEIPSELRVRPKDAPSYDYRRDELLVDSLFREHCHRLGLMYIVFIGVDVAFVVWIWAVYWGELWLLTLSYLAATCATLHLLARFILLRRVNGVARMVQLRSDDHRAHVATLSWVSRFRLLTQSWSIVRWMVLSYALCVLGPALAGLLVLVFFLVDPLDFARHLLVVSAFGAWRLLVAFLVFCAVSVFYEMAVVESFNRALPNAQAVKQYARSRGAESVNELLTLLRQRRQRSRHSHSLDDLSAAATMRLEDLMRLDGNTTTFSNELTHAPPSSRSKRPKKGRKK